MTTAVVSEFNDWDTTAHPMKRVSRPQARMDASPKKPWHKLILRDSGDLAMEVVKKSDRFLEMLKSFERGWEIDEPVMVGTMWSAGSDANSGVYHFVLRNKAEDKTTLLSLPSSPQLLAFLSENSIQVNSLE